MNRRGACSIPYAEMCRRLVLAGLCILCLHESIVAQEDEEDSPDELPKTQLFDLKIPVTPEALRPVKFPLYPCIEERIETAVLQGDHLGKLLKAAGIEDTVHKGFANPTDDEMVGLVLDDETAKPIEGVLLEARYSPNRYQTTTDRNGMFRFKRQLNNAIWTNKEGYGQRIIFSNKEGAESRLILLSKLTYLEGIVTDLQGKPVADAHIHASCSVTGQGTVVKEIQAETRSNADGTYRLCVTSNRYDLHAMAPGRGAVSLSGVKVWHHMARKVRFKLGKTARFEARVIDHQSNEPVEGFVLYRHGLPPIEARSDKQGRIVIEDLIPGPFQFQCGGGERIPNGPSFRYQADSFGRWWSEEATEPFQRFDAGKAAGVQSTLVPLRRNFDTLSFDVKPDMRPVKIEVEAGVAISGLVIDPDGKLVEGATVMPVWSGPNIEERFRVTSDKEGRYRIVVPASHHPGCHLVVHDGNFPEWRGWANGVSKVIQTTPGAAVNNFDLELQRSGELKGILTSDGIAVAGAQVIVGNVDRLDQMLTPRTVTDAEGRFELKCLRSGTYGISVAGNAMKDFRKGIEVEAGKTVDLGEWEVSRK